MNEIRQLSMLKDNHEVFLKTVLDSYQATDWINDDYPSHFKHFWSKYVPGIFKGEREIFSYYIDNDIAGTIVLKKDESEKKVCTLFVLEIYRGRGIASKLLDVAFKWLGTTKPLITIADYKVPQFKKIISRYKWVLSQELRGFYNSSSTEFVYNGKLETY